MYSCQGCKNYVFYSKYIRNSCVTLRRPSVWKAVGLKMDEDSSLYELILPLNGGNNADGGRLNIVAMNSTC